MILLESIISRTTWFDVKLRSIGKQCFHVKIHYGFYTNKTIMSRILQAVSFPTEDKYRSAGYSSK